MPVERRYSERFPVGWELHISYRRQRGFPAMAKNLSLEGFFLETRQLSIPTGTMVELAFTRLGIPWTIPALVIHRNDQGIGVMFRVPQAELYHGINGQRRQRAVESASSAVGFTDLSTRKEPECTAC